MPAWVSRPEHVIFSVPDLLPDQWADLANCGPVRMFNPGLLKNGAGWLLAYRVVGPDRRRRIGACYLDREFRVVPESRVPLSDKIVFTPDDGYSERASTW